MPELPILFSAPMRQSIASSCLRACRGRNCSGSNLQDVFERLDFVKTAVDQGLNADEVWGPDFWPRQNIDHRPVFSCERNDNCLAIHKTLLIGSNHG